MTDEVAGQRSLFAVGESFAIGPSSKVAKTFESAVNQQIAYREF
ncbi:MAG: hypothetical protein SGJ02_06820 [bacterium]|nr:hypothetical protein [bacterium]